MAEHRGERVGRIFRANHGRESRSERHQLRVVAIARVPVAEAPRTAPGQIAEPDVGESDPGERIKQIELSPGWEVALDGAMRQGPVLSPLDVDGDLAAIAPVRVKQVAM